MNKKDLKCIEDGLYHKSGDTFYLECSISHKLCYCPKQRLLELQSGEWSKGFQNYVCRDVNRMLKHGYTLETLKSMGKKEMLAESKKILETSKAKKKDKEELKDHDEKTAIPTKIESPKINYKGEYCMEIPKSFIPEVIKILKEMDCNRKKNGVL